MLFKALHNSTISAMVLGPFLVLALWARYFLVDITHITTLDNPSMPFWDFLVEPYLGYSQFTAALASFVLVLLTGLSINRMVVRYGMLKQQSMMVLIMYGLLSSAFLSVQKLSPVWFFVFFFILGLERLFSGVQKRNATANCFDAAFLLGIGSLFYAKGIFFFPLLLIAMGVLRLANFRSVVAAILGLGFPLILNFSWYFYWNKGFVFFESLSENLVANPGQYNHDVFSRIYMGLIIFITGISILATVRQMGTQKVIVRRYHRVFIWVILISASAVLTPFFSVEMLPLAAIGAAVTISNWLEYVSRKMVKEVILLLIVIVTLLGQWFLF
jgi:hypothetical protein